MLPELERHQLAWCERAAACADPLPYSGFTPGGEAIVLLGDWIRAERPLIVARQSQEYRCGAHRVVLGLPLPLAQGKRRLAFSIPRAQIAHLSPPPQLFEVRHAMPASWQPAVDQLLASSQIVAAAPRVYGSAAMQALTGEVCMDDGSDLDLLFSPAAWPDVMLLVDALACISADDKGRRIDGEIRAPSGKAVAWRELLQRPSRLLCKHLRGAELIDTEAYASEFADAC
jgi:phosphoribosyl-dephospho-CoA transferase